MPSPPNLPWRLPKCTKMPHHLKIWPSRPPTCFKINPQRPKSATTSKSGPGDLQNASKSTPWTPKSPGDLQIVSKSILRGPSPPSPRNLALETSKMLQNRSLDAQVHIISKSGPGDLQNASKSTLRGPSPPSPRNLALENAKILQNRSQDAQVPIISKSSPGELQNASKSTPGHTSAHHLKISSWRPPKCLKLTLRGPSPPSPRNLAQESSKMLQNRPWDAQVPIISA